MPTKHDTSPPLANSQAPARNKKPGGMNIFRAALLRRRHCTKAKPGVSIDSDSSSPGMLNKVVGSMRPLHLQSHRSPQHPQASGFAAPLPSTNEKYEDVLSSPVSMPYKMASSPSRSSASEEGMSRFASTVSLMDLDCESKEDDLDPGIEGGDETIDVKAEQFIAQFYEQMRTQKNHRKVKMSNRQ